VIDPIALQVLAADRREPARAIGRRPLSQSDPDNLLTSVRHSRQDNAQRPNRASSPELNQASVRHNRQVNVPSARRIPMPVIRANRAIRVPTPVDEPALLEVATTRRLIAPQVIAAGQV